MYSITQRLMIADQSCFETPYTSNHCNLSLPILNGIQPHLEVIGSISIQIVQNVIHISL